MNLKPEKIIQESPSAETEIESRIKGGDWLCKNCYNKIASDKERYYYSGSSEFNFTNPQGFQFDIITFTKADGCNSEGEAILDYTWFSGYSWNYSTCSQCGIHLGWKYFGSNTFYGLIKTRLVKALTIMN
ncbi:MAG: cereblon family protein [Ignavibacteria bacterium]|jgi:hypothetical protein